MAFAAFESFLIALAEGGTHDLSVDTLKVYLSNTAPDEAAHTVKADIAEISTGGGYSGPVEPTITSRGIDAVTRNYTIVPSGPIVWTGTGSGFGPLRYAILYNDTAANDELIGYWTYPSEITLIDVDETLTLNLTTADGVLRIIG